MNIPLIYDVGMNNGDDSEYYLAKGFRVVGIDANPEICEQSQNRFKKEVAEGRMSIINAAVTDKPGIVTFHINEAHDRISTLHPEKFREESWVSQSWRAVAVPAVKFSDIYNAHGDAYYIKIDIEHHDQIVLEDLFKSNILPNFISSEAHDIDIFNLLVGMGYDRFQVVVGFEVEERFRDTTIRHLDGTSSRRSFPSDTTGPFGHDFTSAWLTEDQCRITLDKVGLEWTDIHATFKERV